ncbi:restriction endonuclease subunit S [Phaeobacter italicus]|uniref:restriction endonuclease subunit S n=1 Tax=Phaeobacter italicus TaxID=481446 RepID=UPI00351988E0
MTWRQATLGDFVALQRGHDLPTQNRENGTVPIMGSFGVTGHHSKAKAKGPGVTVGRSGASIGVTSYIEQDYWPLNTCMYVTDFKGNNPRYAYYLLQTLDLAAHNSGSAQPSLNRNYIYPIDISFPDRCVQDRIVDLLGSLDDKIELNRRMNETLEEMARALFRDWFVDFGPTRRQMEGATDPAAIMGHAFPPEKAAILAPLFPAKLGDDGLPEGWDKRPLSEICKFAGGSAFKKDDQGYEHGEVPFIKVSDMNLTNNERFILSANNYVDLSDQPRMKFKLHPEGAIVLAKIGIALTYNRLRVLRTPTAIDNNLLSATPLAGSAATTFLFLVLSQIDFNLHAKGSALPYLNASDLAKIEFNFASEALVTEVEKTVRPLFEKVLANSNENQTLAEMRDLLLPKLMSGEIRLKDAEAAV